MRRAALAAFAALIFASPVAVSAQGATSGVSQLELTVQNQLPRYGFHDVDTSTLSTNQLSSIMMALSRLDKNRSDKVRRVRAILADS